MIIGPPPKFHGTRDILHFLGDLLSMYNNTALGNIPIIIAFGALVASPSRAWIYEKTRQRTCTTNTGQPIRYTSLNGGQELGLLDGRKTTDIWSALRAIRADQNTTAGVVRCNSRRRMPYVAELAALGFPRPKMRRYKIPLAAAVATENPTTTRTSAS